MVNTLNHEQLIAYNTMMTGCNCFISGDAGTGKSYLINVFTSQCKKKGKKVAVIAPTGIAALNVDGVTIHRLLKLPIGPLVFSPESIVINKVLMDIDILILEEVSMCRLDIFDYLAISIGKANKMRKEKGLQALQFIVCGDFFQLPPVLIDREKDVLDSFYGYDVGKAFAFQSKYWKAIQFKNIILHTIVRQGDKLFSSLLNSARIGDYSVINKIKSLSCSNELPNAIYLTGTNKAVREKNEAELNKINSKEKVYESDIDGEVNDSDKMTDDILTLKVGARVMTLINDFNDKYKNGSFGTILAMFDDYVTLLMDGGDVVEIRPYTWEIKNFSLNSDKNNSKNKPLSVEVAGTFTQLPLKLAYAITVHKSQGQTYDAVNLNPYCWDCGQLYVALSRVTAIDKMHLTSYLNPNFLITSREVKEFYKSIDYQNIY